MSTEEERQQRNIDYDYGEFIDGLPPATDMEMYAMALMRIDDKDAGKEGVCPQCGAIMRVFSFPNLKEDTPMPALIQAMCHACGYYVCLKDTA